mgnify:CR=1 FL=1|jgi:hypothetical protein
MADFRERLFSKAFKTGPGSEYNAVAHALREQEDHPHRFYEVPLKVQDSWDTLRDHIYPRFIRHLKYKKMDPEVGRGLTIALFFQDRYYLIEGPQFIGVYLEMEGLDASGFHLRVVEWLSAGPH